jgi:hypothetical protein
MHNTNELTLPPQSVLSTTKILLMIPLHVMARKSWDHVRTWRNPSTLLNLGLGLTVGQLLALTTRTETFGKTEAALAQTLSERQRIHRIVL